MRPGTPRSGWAIIVLAVVLIIFFGLAAWVSLPRNPAQGQRPMDHEAVFAVVTGFQERWPSLPGPPERHRQAAADAGPGRPAAAAEELAKAASLDGNDADTLLQLVILAAREPSVTLLGPVQAQEMVAALAETAPSDLLPAARAWQALQRGEPEAALAALGPEDASARPPRRG